MGFPTKDLDVLVALQTFYAVAATNPAKYSFSGPDIAAMLANLNSYQAALSLASAPETKTKVTVEQKNETKAAALGLYRQFANQLRFNSGISDADKIAIGVDPLNPNRTRRDCPQISPGVIVLGGSPGRQLLRYGDVMTGRSEAKPFGATELQLFVAVAPATVASPDEAEFYGKFTKNPIAVHFDSADNGKQATYFARWAGVRGDTGPWSAPVSLAIAA